PRSTTASEAGAPGRRARRNRRRRRLPLPGRRMSGSRRVLAMLFCVTLLAVVLLGFGVVQLARVASRGEFAGIETFGFALVLGATALVLPSAVGWFAYRALDRQI